MKEHKCPRCNQNTFIVGKNTRFPSNPRTEDYRHIALCLDSYIDSYNLDDLPRVEAYIKKYRKETKTDFEKLREQKKKELNDKLFTINDSFTTNYSLDGIRREAMWRDDVYKIPKHISDFLRDSILLPNVRILDEKEVYFSNIAFLYNEYSYEGDFSPKDLFKIYKCKPYSKSGELILTNGLKNRSQNYINFFFRTELEAQLANELIADEYKNLLAHVPAKFKKHPDLLKYIQQCDIFTKKYNGPKLHDLMPEYYL
jgi:hypothetical protein